MSGASDFDFLHRNWNVQHRKLLTRLEGADNWIEFGGTSSTRPIMSGQGNIEDNVINDPGGAYRAAALRAFDGASGLWRIWWLDLRSPSTLGVPVVGRFEGGKGEFIADDTWMGRPIKVRFVWLKDAGIGPRWEQSFSPDDGQTWELNWSMQFS
jgi:hypothetical protein